MQSKGRTCAHTARTGCAGSLSLAIHPASTSCCPVSVKSVPFHRIWYQTGLMCENLARHRIATSYPLLFLRTWTLRRELSEKPVTLHCHLPSCHWGRSQIGPIHDAAGGVAASPHTSE